jgi:hypothetical protein
MMRYADVIDPQVVAEIIPGDWQNSIQIVQSGLVSFAGEPLSSSLEDFIREDLFNSDEDGQTVGVGSQIDLKDLVQNKYSIPIVNRADGATLDDIEGDITAQVRTKVQDNFIERVMEKAGRMLEGVAIATAVGCGAKLVSAAENYKDGNGSQVSLALINELRSKRGDQGKFQGGFMLMRGDMLFKLGALGLISESSNTTSVNFKDQIVNFGEFSKILGMTPVVSDRVPTVPSETDQYIYLMEAGAIKMKGAGRPMIDPIIRATDAFADIVKFRIRVGGTVLGMGYSGTRSDKISNTDLQTATNWARAAKYAKNVKMAVLRVDAPTF